MLPASLKSRHRPLPQDMDIVTDTEKPTLLLPLSVMDYTGREMNCKIQKNNARLATREEGCRNE